MAKLHKVPRNQTQYNCLASEYIVIDRDGSLNRLSHVANNLYNAALYQLRQQWIKHRKWRSYGWLVTLFQNRLRERANMLYGQFPYRQCAQQTLKEVSTVWYAWSRALKAYKANPHKFTGRPRMPHYLPKGKRHVFYVTNQNAKIKDGYLLIQPRNHQINVKLKLRNGITKLQRVSFKPLSRGRFKVIIQYKTTKLIQYKPDNHRYLGIDPGLDNAFTCASNDPTLQPLIISGQGVKSVNHRYNKLLAKYSQWHAINRQCFTMGHTKQGLKPFYYQSKAQQRITDWRNQKVYAFCHYASKRIVDYALNNDLNTIVIGKNKSQKRSINMGRKNNQNFVGLPHAKMIAMITYKANLAGITVITANESYTSQTSFLDHEKPCRQNGNDQRRLKHLTPAVRRIHRGLFKTNHGVLINADINGALQIIKKVFPDVSYAEGIAGAVLRPVKLRPTF